MSKLPKKSIDIDLRRLFPEVALQMDTQVLLHQAKQLGIHLRINRSKTTPVLRIPLSLDHEISISPVDKGAQGFAEWFTFARQCECPKKHPKVTSRVYIQIEDKLFGKNLSESFTIEAPDFEMMIRISLTVYYSITGKKLQPLIKNGRMVELQRTSLPRNS